MIHIQCPEGEGFYISYHQTTMGSSTSYLCFVHLYLLCLSNWVVKSGISDSAVLAGLLPLCHSLVLKASNKHQIIHCSLHGARLWVKPPLDFSIPCYRWPLLCWCLSRVFSPRVSPAREVEEEEHTVQPLQESTLITDHHIFRLFSSHFGIKRESASCWLKKKQKKTTFGFWLWGVSAAHMNNYPKSCLQ